MVVVVNGKLGNVGSVQTMLRKIGAEVRISSEVSDIAKADKLILPGVGAFDVGMKRLNELGLIPVLNHKVLEEKVPILGICLGMQLLGKRSDEGEIPGLGWLDAETVRFRFEGADTKLKVPHMGWNHIAVDRVHPLFKGLEEEARFYFVHSFHFEAHDAGDKLATTHYGYDFTSSVQRGNILGVQFHPEKSHKFGLQLFRNFMEFQPC